MDYNCGRIPAEVLVNIILQLLHPGHRKHRTSMILEIRTTLALLLTCKRWREVGLFMREVNAGLLCIERQPLDFVDQCLRLSGTYPISIIADAEKCTLKPEDLKANWQRVIQELNRCDHFFVRLHHTRSLDIENLQTALQNGAPNLLNFTLFDDFDTLLINDMNPTTRPFQNSPRLQSIHLYGRIALDCRLYPFTGPLPLTKIVINRGPESFQARGREQLLEMGQLTSQCWMKRLRMSSATLRSLALIGVQHKNVSLKLRLVNFPVLESLRVGGELDDVAQLLERMTIPNACHFSAITTLCNLLQMGVAHHLKQWK
ncbi:hypothetical protein H1R20_g5537, partial [Candolleomyces eurysporus]